MALLYSILSTLLLCALPAPTPSSAKLNATPARPAPSTLSLAKLHAAAAPKARLHPPAAPPAAAHAKRALPAASVPLQVRLIPSCANQALSLPLLAQHLAPPAPRARFRLLLVRLHATPALPAPTVLQLRRSSAAAPSTRMPPHPMVPALVPAPARPALGKLYPSRGKASA
jgi:hypothetical protein